MFVEGKVIDPEKVQAAVSRKQGVNFNIIEDDIIPKLIDIRETTRKRDGISTPSQDKDINVYDTYQFCFRINLYGLTLDELEYIYEHNLFDLQKDNLLDYRCQLILEKKIEDFRQTLDYLNRSVMMDNVGSYFQKFGSIYNQCLQGAKLEVILGLNREDTPLTPLGEKLKTCIENIRTICKDFQKNAEEVKNPTSQK